MSDDSEKIAGMAIYGIARDIDEKDAKIKRLRGLVVDGIELAECTSPYVHGTAIRRREWAARVREAPGE